MNTVVEGRPTFGVGQCGSARLAVLNYLIKLQARRGKALRVLEIGAYEGGSALAWSGAIAQHGAKGGVVHCVDPWVPYLPADDVASNQTCHAMQNELRSGAVFERFKANLQYAAPGAPISYDVGTLPQVSKRLGAQRSLFDVVFIDGSHAYADVREDLRAAVPLLRIGGFLCGDDLEKQLYECVRAQVEAIKTREYVEGYHPGVTLAVGERFGKVWCREGVWAMQKLDQLGKRWKEPHDD